MFKVALVGKPNVGKSSLFNVLLKKRRSIVLDLPGTTLDVVREKTRWFNHSIELSDTQGIFSEKEIPQILNLIGDQNVFVFVVDGREAATPFDRVLARAVLGRKRPTLLCLNKTENGEENLEEWIALGFSEFVFTSASHRRNIHQIEEWAIAQIPKQEETLEPAEEKPYAFTLALLGKPNTGKSTLMNRLCQREVSRVSPLPLTTRDYISYEVEIPQGKIKILDTAGMRRPRSKKEKVESFSIQASLKAIEEAEVILLCLACHEPVSDQDMRLLNLLERSGKPVLILLNFWDRLKKSEQKLFMEDSEFRNYLEKFVTLPISGLSGFQTEKVLPSAFRLFQRSKSRIPTSDLNRVVEKLIERNPPPSVGNKNFNILYASQVKASPPTFVFFLNRKESLPKSYEAYLINGLKNQLRLKGQTVRLHFRSSRKH